MSWDTAFTVGSSLLSGWLNNSAALQRQHDAQDFSADQFARRYQTTVKDMQAAGLNPMLAYTQGGGSPPTSAASSSSGYPDLGNTYLQSKMNSAQVAQVNAQEQLTKQQTQTSASQATALEAQAARDMATARRVDTEIDLMTAQIRRIEEELPNLRAMTSQITSQTDKNLADAGLSSIRQISEQVQQVLTQAQTGKVQADTHYVTRLTEKIAYDIQYIQEQIRTHRTQQTLNLSMSDAQAALALLNKSHDMLNQYRYAGAAAESHSWSGESGSEYFKMMRSSDLAKGALGNASSLGDLIKGMWENGSKGGKGPVRRPRAIIY